MVPPILCYECKTLTLTIWPIEYTLWNPNFLPPIRPAPSVGEHMMDPIESYLSLVVTFGCSYISHHVGVCCSFRNLGRILKLWDHIFHRKTCLFSRWVTDCVKFGRSRLNGVGVGSAESNGTSMWTSSAPPFKVTAGHRKWQRSIGFSLTIHSKVGSISQVCFFRGKRRLRFKTHFPTPCV